jgi:hypothetical protein
MISALLSTLAALLLASGIAAAAIGAGYIALALIFEIKVRLGRGER